MRSAIVIISWWANCLALRCLQHLTPRPAAADLFVLHVGKPAHQRDAFRRLAPDVTELPYPPDAPADHCRVIAFVARRALRNYDSVLFLDHDVFLDGDLGEWLTAAEHRLRARGCLLAVPDGRRASLTSPAFWLAPAHWPDDLSFDPQPFTPCPEARHPGRVVSAAPLRLPGQDTLFVARDALGPLGRVAVYPTAPPAGELPPFPAHEHLGGLYLFSLGCVPPGALAWARDVTGRFVRFFDDCPPAWLDAEDPVLPARLAHFAQVTHE